MYMFRQLSSCASSLQAIKSLTLAGFMHPQKVNFVMPQGACNFRDSLYNYYSIIKSLLCNFYSAIHKMGYHFISTPSTTSLECALEQQIFAQILNRYPVSPKEEMRLVDLHGVLVWSPPPHTVEPLYASCSPKGACNGEIPLCNIMFSLLNIYLTSLGGTEFGSSCISRFVHVPFTQVHHTYTLLAYMRTCSNYCLLQKRRGASFIDGDIIEFCLGKGECYTPIVVQCMSISKFGKIITGTVFFRY